MRKSWKSARRKERWSHKGAHDKGNIVLSTCEQSQVLFLYREGDIMYTNEQLQELQNMPLDDKIQMSKLRISEFVEHYGGNAVVSFSGGKDSTVLLHLARTLYPEIKGVYCDTGLEYPEVKEHVKATKNIEIIRPAMSFKQVLDKYGWVFSSKETAGKIHYARKGSQWAIRCMQGLNHKDGSYSKFCQRYKRWAFLVDSPFKISDKCCSIMKKKPFHDYAKKNNCGMLVGTMTEESTLRKRRWLEHGCNAFNAGLSMPLSFWKGQDIFEYIVKNNITIASCYGDIVKENSRWVTTKCKRTGCMFCPIGVHLEKYPNRFQRMATDYPKIYNYCINKLELGKLLDYVSVPYKPIEIAHCGGKEI